MDVLRMFESFERESKMEEDRNSYMLLDKRKEKYMYYKTLFLTEAKRYKKLQYERGINDYSKK